MAASAGWRLPRWIWGRPGSPLGPGRQGRNGQVVDPLSALASPCGPQAGKWDSGEELEDPVHRNPRGDKIMLDLTQLTIFSCVLINQALKYIISYW